MEQIVITETTIDFPPLVVDTETGIVTDIEEVTTTTTIEIFGPVVSDDLSKLAGIDVDLLNTFLYAGTSFFIGFFFVFVCKAVYRFFNIFF